MKRDSDQLTLVRRLNPRGDRYTAMPAALMVLAWVLTSCISDESCFADPVQVVFSGGRTVSKQWTLKELDSQLPADWTGYEFLVLEFKASSPQRFDLELHTSQRIYSKRVHPFEGALVRAAIPLKYYSTAPQGGNDLASLSNKLAGSYFMNIEAGGHGPLNDIQALGVTMHDPVGSPTLEIRSVKLVKTSPGDEVIEPKVLVDEFGQWIPADWPGKAKTLDELKTAWTDEQQSLGKNPVPDRDQYGGFLSTSAKSTGFFRVEQIDGRWWFVDPDGHLFFSTGANGIGTASATRITGREKIFTALPPANLSTNLLPAFPGASTPASQPGVINASFYTWNLSRRYGDEWRQRWADVTVHRMTDWGLNTCYGRDPELLAAKPRQPFVLTLRRWQSGQGGRAGSACRMFTPTTLSSAWMPRQPLRASLTKMIPT